MIAMNWNVKIVDPSRTYELRHRVLRPGRPFSETTDHDAFVSAVTFGLTQGEPRQILATATVYREEPPPTYAPLVRLSETHRPWRLRAVATDELRQREGLGRLVLNTIIDYITESESALLWCNARITAREFYTREGFLSYGPIFEVAHIGSHIVMYRAIARI